MPRGVDLWRDEFTAWFAGQSSLVCSPRLPRQWKDRILAQEFPEGPGRVWLATSGTGGILKLVALSTAALEASAQAVNSHLGCRLDDVWINPLPLFHVGGLGIVVRATLCGARWESCGAWSANAFVSRANEVGATLASLVPAQVYDLAQAGCDAPESIRAVVVGGGVLDESLLMLMRSRGWNLLPSYGLTEAASQVATAAVTDAAFEWLPLLSHVEARLGEGGVLELRGSSLLDGWMLFHPDGSVTWDDPKRGGWLRTGDRAELRGRKIRVLGRVDDLVKIRGELVDLAALERALQTRVPSGRVMVRCVSDARNGAALHVVAENDKAAVEVGEVVEKIFPPFARPESLTTAPIARTALGKTVR